MRAVVGVLRGGPSREYDVSLKTGASVLESLARDTYEPRDIFIDRSGAWHVHGVEQSPEKALKGVDVVFNAMHGDYGEDGQVQRVLERLGVPYTGSGALGAALSYNKHQAKEAARRLGVRVAHGQVLEQTDDIEGLAQTLFRTFPHPAVVKPVAGGSSIGLVVVDTYHGLERALRHVFEHSPQAIIEEYIPGREATVGVINNFRGEDVYALMPLEIRLPPGVRAYDYYTKYEGAPQFVLPAGFSDEQKAELADAARKVHAGLDLAHYSRSDFKVSKRGIYFLEVNALPDMFDSSEFTHMLHAVGSNRTHFLDHVLTLARNGRSR